LWAGGFVGVPEFFVGVPDFLTEFTWLDPTDGKGR
jgi:hypothetical protein